MTEFYVHTIQRWRTYHLPFIMSSAFVQTPSPAPNSGIPWTRKFPRRLYCSVASTLDSSVPVFSCRSVIVFGINHIAQVRRTSDLLYHFSAKPACTSSALPLHILICEVGMMMCYAMSPGRPVVIVILIIIQNASSAMQTRLHM